MIFVSEQDYKNRKQVVDAYQSAIKIVKVCGGWAVFESASDYATWKNAI